jgi:hypothetical protein
MPALPVRPRARNAGRTSPVLPFIHANNVHERAFRREILLPMLRFASCATLAILSMRLRRFCPSTAATRSRHWRASSLEWCRTNEPGWRARCRRPSRVELQDIACDARLAAQRVEGAQHSAERAGIFLVDAQREGDLIHLRARRIIDSASRHAALLAAHGGYRDDLGPGHDARGEGA